MKRQLILLFSALAVLAGVNQAIAQGTAFTYQGQLDVNGNLTNGIYDFKFDVFNSLTGGSAIGGPVTNFSVPVSNGVFTTIIDFGAGVFTGNSNWLHIQVRTNGSGGFTSLTPRQQMTPAPYAIFAEGANGGGITGSIPNSALNPDVALLDGTQTFTGVNSFNNSISMLNPSSTIVFPATGGANSPMMAMFSSGTDNADRRVIAHSLFYPNWGLQYQDSTDQFNFLSAGTPVLTVNLGSQSIYAISNVGIGTSSAAQQYLSVHGGLNIDQINLNGGFLNNGSNNGFGLSFGSGSGEGIASERVAGANQYGLDFYTSFTSRMSLNNSGNLQLNGNDLYLLEGNANYGLGYRTSVAGLAPNGGDGPFLYGYDVGYLGTRGPDEVSLWWNYQGNVWVSNNLSVASLTLRGSSASESLSVSGQNVLASGQFLGITGLGGVQPYIGDDGHGNDVQIGSLTSGITSVACYNAADNVYMHLYCSSITIEGGADVAEPFPISEPGHDQPILPGSVVVIDERNPGQLRLSDRAYDTRVAGVVSGANGIHPGIQMQQQGLLEGGKNVSLTGRVYVQADASNGAIKPGDLLTTSSIPGRAMKVSNHSKAQGAILGKAMTGLSEGKGMVLVLVTLQ